ncbi:hypothetical protein CERSUDRAFT_50620 [Gelatoporia subvermispora B]|uniref:Cytochrome P450 n=1 Tax=Ceriporiopsis subvermispora (strain B) TaxID=914234 RepID=M2REK6_CERS8|nr:hypothetical protein CERSUDRAFT_50620 [Gelatoporia subvermispora B]
MKIAYGINVQARNDPYVRIAEEAMRGPSKAASPGLYLVDTCPVLKYITSWFPGAGFKKETAEFRKSLDALLRTPYEDFRGRLLEGKAPKCAATSLLQTFGNSSEAESDIKITPATMYIGMLRPTVSTLSIFFLAMIFHPDVQAKAQDELDTVLGGGRLPELSDQASMPDITCVMKESLRWKPVASINLPHRLTQDDVYRGYQIPRVSIVCSNNRAILHDEDVYPNSPAFDPDRFMRDGALNTELQDPATVALGFGRRICPGRYMAQDMHWIAIASVLTTFNIIKEVNEGGEEVMPETRSLPGFVSHPMPFKCTIRPRSDRHIRLIEAALG